MSYTPKPGEWVCMVDSHPESWVKDRLSPVAVALRAGHAAEVRVVEQTQLKWPLVHFRSGSGDDFYNCRVRPATEAEEAAARLTGK